MLAAKLFCFVASKLPSLHTDNFCSSLIIIRKVSCVQNFAAEIKIDKSLERQNLFEQHYGV